jgi:dihydrofolate reductase
MHGGEGGETGPDDDVMREHFAGLGATIMGRNMFGGYPGDWGDGAWKGWWGDEPPFHHPVFVITHYARDPLVLGETTFHFVTDGIESALRQAKAAAGSRDVGLGGGAEVAQQYLAAGLIDEIELNVVPIFLKGGERLFDNIEGFDKQLEVVRAVPGNGVTHLKYRVVR